MRPAVREIAVAILRSLGYRVLEAPDGDEGLRVFGAHAAEIDMLLTDVVLPGKVRGRELAERITAIRPEVKVLFMSGYTENSIVHHGRLDDGVQLLGKPFKREQLARKVAEVLGTVAGRMKRPKAATSWTSGGDSGIDRSGSLRPRDLRTEPTDLLGAGCREAHGEFQIAVTCHGTCRVAGPDNPGHAGRAAERQRHRRLVLYQPAMSLTYRHLLSSWPGSSGPPVTARAGLSGPDKFGP